MASLRSRGDGRKEADTISGENLEPVGATRGSEVHGYRHRSHGVSGPADSANLKFQSRPFHHPERPLAPNILTTNHVSKTSPDLPAATVPGRAARQGGSRSPTEKPQRRTIPGGWVRDSACSLLEGPSRLKRWHKRLCSSQSCVSSNDQAAGSAVPSLPPAASCCLLLRSPSVFFLEPSHLFCRSWGCVCDQFV